MTPLFWINLIFVCMRGRAERLRDGGQKRGVSTHTNERNKLLIGVFIRAVGRQESFTLSG
jgi:hypothetical protein